MRSALHSCHRQGETHSLLGIFKPGTDVLRIDRVLRLRSIGAKAYPPFKKRRLLGRLISWYIRSIILTIFTPEGHKQRNGERSSHAKMLFAFVTEIAGAICLASVWDSQSSVLPSSIAELAT